MPNLLFDVHQRSDNSWRWHGSRFGSDDLLVISRRCWPTRVEAAFALKRFLELLALRNRR